METNQRAEFDLMAQKLLELKNALLPPDELDMQEMTVHKTFGLVYASCTFFVHWFRTGLHCVCVCVEVHVFVCRS